MYGANYYGRQYYGQAYQGGIQFDATSGSGYQAASASYNWSHTVGVGANQILVVSVGLLSAVNSVTSITYNGVALTKLRSDVSVSTTVRTEIWYLVAPTQGTNTVAVTLNTASVSGSTASSYNGVDQVTPADAQNGDSQVTGGGGGSSTVSTTTVTNGAWLVDAVATADTAITPTNLQTATGNITGAVGSVGMSEKFPNAIGATAVTMGWDNIAALTTWTMSTMALRPSTGFNVYLSALTATLSFIGTFTKRTSYPLVATLSFVATVAKRTSRSLVGTVSFVGTLTKKALRSLTGTLSFVGNFAKLGKKALTGTVSFVGAINKRTTKTTFTGSLTFVGNFIKTAVKRFTGTLNFSSVFSKQIRKVLTGTLGFTTGVTRLVSHSFTATLSFVGNMTKGFIRRFTASLSFVGSLVTSRIYIMAFTATLSFVGNWSKYMAATFINMFTTVKTGVKNTTETTGKKVVNVKTGDIMKDVSTGIKNQDISGGDTDTTVTTGKDNTAL